MATAIERLPDQGFELQEKDGRAYVDMGFLSGSRPRSYRPSLQLTPTAPCVKDGRGRGQPFFRAGPRPLRRYPLLAILLDGNPSSTNT